MAVKKQKLIGFEVVNKFAIVDLFGEFAQVPVVIAEDQFEPAEFAQSAKEIGEFAL